MIFKDHNCESFSQIGNSHLPDSPCKPELEMLHAQTLITMRESQQKTEEIKARAAESNAKAEELQNQIKLKEVEAKAREAENVRMQLELEKQKMEIERQKMELENQIKLKQAENAQVQIQFQKQQLDLEKARLDNERLRENQDQILDQARADESLLNKRLLAYEKRFNDLERKMAEERQDNDRKLAEREKQWAQEGS